jgi:flagellar assembly factor FliW
MPQLASKYFGALDFSPEAVFLFRSGIPGFEDHQAFVFLEQPHTAPLVFMQSYCDPSLCFITVPVFVADPDYRLELSPDELAGLGLPAGSTPRIGTDVLCLALVTVAEGVDPSVNLAAPIVLNLTNREGIQGMEGSSGYSYRHPLVGQESCVPCS